MENKKIEKHRSSTAKLIVALNQTLIANKEVGRYHKLEEMCLEKLYLLISSIK